MTEQINTYIAQHDDAPVDGMKKRGHGRDTLRSPMKVRESVGYRGDYDKESDESTLLGPFP